jgi:anaerobic glycerol-3-phosphate dehydrogenase
MSNKYQSDVIIIGGGLAGITTAIELLDHGKKVMQSNCWTTAKK